MTKLRSRFNATVLCSVTLCLLCSHARGLGAASDETKAIVEVREYSEEQVLLDEDCKAPLKCRVFLSVEEEGRRPETRSTLSYVSPIVRGHVASAGRTGGRSIGAGYSVFVHNGIRTNVDNQTRFNIANNMNVRNATRFAQSLVDGLVLKGVLNGCNLQLDHIANALMMASKITASGCITTDHTACMAFANLPDCY